MLFDVYTLSRHFHGLKYTNKNEAATKTIVFSAGSEIGHVPMLIHIQPLLPQLDSGINTILVNRCSEPSQPLGIISGLKETHKEIPS